MTDITTPFPRPDDAWPRSIIFSCIAGAIFAIILVLVAVVCLLSRRPSKPLLAPKHHRQHGYIDDNRLSIASTPTAVMHFPQVPMETRPAHHHHGRRRHRHSHHHNHQGFNHKYQNSPVDGFTDLPGVGVATPNFQTLPFGTVERQNMLNSEQFWRSWLLQNKIYQEIKHGRILCDFVVYTIAFELNNKRIKT